MRGPSIDDVLAVLWAICGLGIAAYFVVLGLQNRDMGASPVPLLVLATALSTVVHVAVARALHAAAPQGPWLAWMWSDQGVWLAVLAPDVVGPLNRQLGRALVDPWRWVHDEAPRAAGD